MEDIRAIDIAKWFIKNDYDTPRDTYDGNMKLQKLLYFAQLIHVAKFGELLFKDDMRAFENGTVINNVRLTYKNKPYTLVEESKTSSLGNGYVIDTLKITADLFGDLEAKELSDLNHELNSWSVPFNESKTNIPNHYKSDRNIINPNDSLFLEDVEKVKQMIESYEEEDSMSSEVINGVTFYYDSEEIKMTGEVMEMLEELDCPEEVYTLTNDKEQGLILL